MIIGLIVACEVGFWVLLAAGLTARYCLRWPRVGAAFLICVPLVDVVLLVATVISLRGGAVATAAHGLAGAYIGFSVAFGHGLIKAADGLVAHGFAGGPAPARRQQRGWPRVRHEWQVWLRAVLAWCVGCGVLLLAMVAVGHASRTQQLNVWIQGLAAVLVLWLVARPAAHRSSNRLAPSLTARWRLTSWPRVDRLVSSVPMSGRGAVARC